MDGRSVVTCFLRNDGELLLLRRSDAVGSYQGRWGGVAGHLADDDGRERDPETAARAEIAEGTGLADAVTAVLTEQGRLSTAEVEAVAAAHREWAAWES